MMTEIGRCAPACQRVEGGGAGAGGPGEKVMFPSLAPWPGGGVEGGKSAGSCGPRYGGGVPECSRRPGTCTMEMLCLSKVVCDNLIQ